MFTVTFTENNPHGGEDVVRLHDVLFLTTLGRILICKRENDGNPMHSMHYPTSNVAVAALPKRCCNCFGIISKGSICDECAMEAERGGLTGDQIMELAALWRAAGSELGRWRRDHDPD